MNRSLREKLVEKSIKLEQAEHAVMLADRAASLAEFRRTETDYHKQQERAVKANVDSYVNGEGDTTTEGEAVPEDDETVTTTVDLGDRYTEEHHHHHHEKPDTVTNTTTTTTDKIQTVGGAAGGGTGATGTNGTPAGTNGGVGSSAAPWVAAAMAGPLGAALVGWWMASSRPDPAPVVQPSGVNVQDVSSAVQFEVFDEDGKRLEYIYSPQRPTPKPAP